MITDADIEKLKAVFATKDDLIRFATKDDLKQFATKEDLENLTDKFATKDEIHILSKEVAELFGEVYARLDRIEQTIIQITVSLKQTNDSLKLTNEAMNKRFKETDDKFYRLLHKIENHDHRLSHVEETVFPQQ